jgi:hypothetical protein
MCKIDVKGKAAICSNEVGKDNDEQNFEIKESKRAPVQNAILEISEQFFASRVERRRCHLVVIGVPEHEPRQIHTRGVAARELPRSGGSGTCRNFWCRRENGLQERWGRPWI